MMTSRTRLQAVRDTVNQADFKNFRCWVQVTAFALAAYGAYLPISLGEEIPAFFCGFNAGRGGVCYLLPLQYWLGRPWQVLFSAEGLIFFTSFLAFVLWVLLLNKSWCGFICPLGTIQDWISTLRRRLKIRCSNYTRRQFVSLSRIKYVLLALLILIPLAINFGAGIFFRDIATPFCSICPARMLLPAVNGDFSQLTLDLSSGTAIVMTALGMAVMGLFLAGAFVKKRFFCMFCPMSALIWLISGPALLKLKKNGGKCTRCGGCYRVCDMGIRDIADDMKTKDIMTDNCTLCLKCVAFCPEPGALKATFAGIPVFESTEEGFIRRMKKEHNDSK